MGRVFYGELVSTEPVEVSNHYPTILLINGRCTHAEMALKIFDIYGMR
jgi:hypothetical protein